MTLRLSYDQFAHTGDGNSYASHSANSYNLPIPNSLSALTLALPPVAGLCLETSNALASSLSSYEKSHSGRRIPRTTIPPVLLPSTLTLIALLIYSTVIATLAGTRIAPIGGLACSLAERWSELFKQKDGDAIGRIQDTFSCCGFRTTRDMAFPFPARGRGPEACENAFGYTRPCLELWRGEERLVSGLMLGVAVGVFVWMV